MLTKPETRTDVAELMAGMGRKARAAARPLALAGTATKDAALNAMAEAIERQEQAILAANAIDMAAGAEAGLAASFLDRLKLTPARIAGIADGIRSIAALKDQQLDVQSIQDYLPNRP